MLGLPLAASNNKGGRNYFLPLKTVGGGQPMAAMVALLSVRNPGSFQLLLHCPWNTASNLKVVSGPKRYARTPAIMSSIQERSWKKAGGLPI